MPKLSVVLDTNVFISSLLAPNNSISKIIAYFKSGYYQLIISNPMILELQDVINRPKYSLKYHISAHEKQNLIKSIHIHAKIINKLSKPKIKIRDVEDLIILATALDGHADYLVTGDKDLLVLASYKSIKPLKIITPIEFIHLFMSSDEFFDEYLEEREKS